MTSTSTSGRWRRRLLVGVVSALGLALTTGAASPGLALAVEAAPRSVAPALPVPEPDPDPPGTGGGTSPGTGDDTPDTGGATPGTGGTGGTDSPDDTRGRPATPPADDGPTPSERAANAQRNAAQDAAERQRDLAQNRAERAAEIARDRAEAAAKARAQAAKRAAQLAAAAQTARTAWERRGRPAKLVIVRARNLDVVTNGELTRRVVRSGPLTVPSLDRYLPGDWLTVADGTATLSATLMLSQGVKFDVGGPVTTLRLVGGATAPEAASVYTGGGAIDLTGVTVTSLDPASGQPMAPGNGRPFVVVSKAGSLTATDATISDLGTNPDGGENGRAGVQFNAGSSGALVRTTLLRNSTGLKLSGSQGVRLDGVTIAESAADGLILQGDVGTALAGVRAERNAGNGVLVTGPSTERPVTGITTAGNGAFGVAMTGQTRQRITGVSTSGDQSGGLRIGRSSDVVVSDYSASDQAIGIFTHVGSTGLVLERITVEQGRRGVVFEKSTTNAELRSSTISGARVAGVAIGGKQIRLTGVTVAESKTGVRIERGSHDVTATGLTVSGGEDGVVATPGSEKVLLQDLVAEDVGNDAIRTFSADARIIGGRISGGATGIDAQAATTISGISILAAAEGIRSRSTELVRAEGVDVATTSLGVNVAAGSPFVLADSRVQALEAVRGELNQQGLNEVSLPPLNLLGAIGVPLIILALVLEQIHAFRQRRFGGPDRRRQPPALPATG
jgi:hypothetical protein